MKKFLSILLILMLCVVNSPGNSFAASTQVDALIRKLVDKGILTKSEAIELKGEIAADEKMMKEENLKTGLPEWVQNTKLKGDFRLRYQYERKKNDQDSRDRGRARYRLGIESQVNEKVKVGAGISSGADDPRSTNQTFQDTFERSDVRLDLAYGEYVHNKNFKMIGGIFNKKDYLWAPSDMLWDTDINPTGGAFHLEGKYQDETITPYLNTGVLLVDESLVSDKQDPFIVYTQGGLKWQDKKEGPKFDTNLAATYYSFNGIQGQNLDWCSGTNSGRSSGANSSGTCGGSPTYDFDSIVTSLEIGANGLFGGLPLNIDDRIALFSDFVYNPNPTELNKGWALGGYFGHKKVANWKQWQMRYQFTSLGKDAWYDAFPDSDRNGGATDSAGHEAIFEYGLSKNVTLSLDYYNDNRIKGTKNRQQLIQADVNFKF